MISFDRSTHEYRDAQGIVLPSVTQILADANIVDFSAVKEEVRRRAMRRGTSVHFVCQLWDEAALNYRTVPVALRGYLRAWKTWRKASGFSPLLIEQPFVSPHGYAGTPDRFGTFPNGSYATIDLKSGEGDVAEWVGLQLAPYSKWYAISMKIGRIRRIGIQLHADGTYRVREFPTVALELDFAKFMKAFRDYPRER